MSKRILGMGNAVLDILAEANEAELTKNNLIKESDVIVCVDISAIGDLNKLNNKIVITNFSGHSNIEKKINDKNLLKKILEGQLLIRLLRFHSLAVILVFAVKLRTMIWEMYSYKAWKKWERNFYVKWQIMDYLQLDA